MKTFEDLVFEPHWLAKEGDNSEIIQARAEFDNGYEVSVIKGLPRFNKSLYEIGVFYDDEFIDIIGCNTKNEVTLAMETIQLWEPF